MKTKHPKIFQNTALILGSAAVLIFAVAFSVFAYNVYNNPASADSKSDLADCKWFFSDFATRIDKIKLTQDDQKKFEDFKKRFNDSNLTFDKCYGLANEMQSFYARVTEDSYAKTLKSGSDTKAESGAGPTSSNSGSSSSSGGTPSGTSSGGTSSGQAQTNPSPVIGNDFEFLSKQDYSAVAISGLPESPQCKEKKVGQVVVVTDIKDFEASGDKRVEVAVSTGGYYTKRGTLQKISDNYVDKIIEGYGKSIYAASKSLDKEMVASGLYFPNVPVDSALKIQLYSPSWGSKIITLVDVPKISTECETIFVPVFSQQGQDGDMDVCVHSTDKSKDYSPKKTFAYPKEKEEAKKFEDDNKNLVVSLGPCQKVAEIAKEVNAQQSLQQSAEEKKAASIGYTDDPGGTGSSKTGSTGSTGGVTSSGTGSGSPSSDTSEIKNCIKGLKSLEDQASKYPKIQTNISASVQFANQLLAKNASNPEELKVVRKSCWEAYNRYISELNAIKKANAGIAAAAKALEKDVLPATQKGQPSLVKTLPGQDKAKQSSLVQSKPGQPALGQVQTETLERPTTLIGRAKKAIGNGFNWLGNVLSAPIF